MSNKSGTSNQIISLPKGGGALKGIGEKFSPDIHTGTGNFTVPISMPPGRNGFQPQLNLVYSTGNGNGHFGLGWGINIPGVSRKTSKGVPQYDDTKDIFVLSGAEDLVKIEESVDENGPVVHRCTCYRPRTEGLFARIEHHIRIEEGKGTIENYWEVRSKDGLVSFYGTPRPNNAIPEWEDLAVVSDPSDREKIFSWKLKKTEDAFGNCIVYKYLRDSDLNERNNKKKDYCDQPFLNTIQYVDYDDGNGNEQFLISATFVYENLPDRYDEWILDRERIYPFSDYRAGFEIRTKKRCTNIKLETKTEENGGLITHSVRIYELVYLDQRVKMGDISRDELPRNSVSLLSLVRVKGVNGSRIEELPPLEFNYTEFEPKKRDFFPLKGLDFPGRSLANPDIETVDLFGNGLPDIIEMNGTVRYWRNLGNGEFGLPQQMHNAPGGLRLGDPGVQFIDANGDGRSDLLVTTGGLAGYFPLVFGGIWDSHSFKYYRQAPSFDLKDPEVRLVDLNGDGVTDAIRSGNRMECFFNDPLEGWNKVRFVERRALEEFPNINFSDPRVKWADMTGDGLQDIVLAYDGNVEYWPNLGHGNWGKCVHMQNSPRFPYGYDPKRILAGDVDGDGIADMIYVDDTKVTLWISQCGKGWSDPITITGTPPVSDMDAVRLVDMLGTGVSGVLWSRDVVSFSRENYYFLDFTGGIKPYLLNELNNHSGAVTKVEYSPSTRFYLEDQKRPETRWKTPLPFPVQVVARVEVIDDISKGKLTTEYKYHHGYWDGAEREFRGFGFVEQLDTETFENYNKPRLYGEETSFELVKDKRYFSPPTLNRTWFHQGPVGEEFGEWDEADFSTEFWQGDKQLLQRPLYVTNFLNKLPRRVKRDALRTLRGSMIRTELYALDGTDCQDVPYTVTESLFGVCEVVNKNGDHELSYKPQLDDSPAISGDGMVRIFFPMALGQRTTRWERGDDPMTQFTFTDDYDKYGMARQQTAVALPRRKARQGPSRVNELRILATHTRTEYALPDTDKYIHDRAAHIRTFEFKNPGGITENEPEVLEKVLQDQGNSALKIHEDFRTILDPWKAGHDLPAEVRLVSHTINHYDGDNSQAYIGRTEGVGPYGALTRSESLAFTDDDLDAAYRSYRPKYLDGNDDPPNGAPAHFGNKIGYRRERRSAAGYHDGYYIDTICKKYDFHIGIYKRGITVGMKDALGHESTIKIDKYLLFPEEVTDPAGLTTRASYDYRVLQPKKIIDPNGNNTVLTFTPLGLLESTAVMGKEDENEGDTPEEPGIRMIYDFTAFKDRGQPISVRTIRRTHHFNEDDVPIDEMNETIDTIEYSDGFGRLLQTRTQAEDVIFDDPGLENPVFGDAGLPVDQSHTPGDAMGKSRNPGEAFNVVVSGWQIYDNKGRVVEKYEPFFSTGWDYAPPAEREFGRKATMFYDPPGRVVRTVNPDGSEQLAINGIPSDLSNPHEFSPTPWENYTYDSNDNAGRTHPRFIDLRHNFDTPTSTVVDALGRTIQTIQRNRMILRDGSLSPVEEYIITSAYDIQGNLLKVKDAMGRDAFEFRYDLIKRQLCSKSIDAGWHITIPDALNNPVEQRDSKGAAVLRTYDVLNRPVRMWARDDNNNQVKIREKLEYGDNGDKNQRAGERNARRLLNLLGKLHEQYDEAGLLTFVSYDLKGNLLEKKREVIADSVIVEKLEHPPSDWKIKAYSVDWDAGIPLGPGYSTEFMYDALNRIKTMKYPQDVDGERKILKPTYNRAGALESVKLDDAAYVERIVYNAKGQRTLIAYGNNVMTRYAYDEKTFRLARMRTEYYTKLDDLTYQPDIASSRNKPLQDFAYEYDLAGNILKIRDQTPGCGTQSQSNSLDREFSYDALYRLLKATGRQCDVLPSETPGQPWNAQPCCEDVNRTRDYFENYVYDLAGNLIRLVRGSGPTGYTRILAIMPGTNRLFKMTINGATYSYTYDDSGNLVEENGFRHFEWDHSNKMKVYRYQVGDSEPTAYVQCLYDSAGNRVKKLVRNQGAPVEVTIYIDGVFEHCYRLNPDGTVLEEDNTLHVMDDTKRIAMARAGGFSDDLTPAVKYHIGDHLGSSSIVIDDSGDMVNCEEYTPYGETSFGSFARKRYRFTGKERDEESGLYYHGARYYAPWLGRWVSCDPVEKVNLYVYCRNNPVGLFDLNGMDEGPPDQDDNANPPPPLDQVSTSNHSSVGGLPDKAQKSDSSDSLDSHALDKYLDAFLEVVSDPAPPDLAVGAKVGILSGLSLIHPVIPIALASMSSGTGDDMLLAVISGLLALKSGPSLLQRANQAGVREYIEEGPIEVYAHGTTAAVADKLVVSQGGSLSANAGNFGGKFFTVPSMDVAEVFATRSATKVAGQQPAVVGLALPRAISDQLKARGLLKLGPIENPPPGVLPSAQQWTFQPGALDTLKTEGFFFHVQ